MDDYIDKVLTGFPEEIFEIVPSPAGDRLIKIRNEDKKKELTEEHGITYHHVILMRFDR